MNDGDPTPKNRSWEAPTRLTRAHKVLLPPVDEPAYAQLVQIQAFPAWLWLAAFGVLALAALIWALFG